MNLRLARRGRPDSSPPLAEWDSIVASLRWLACASAGLHWGIERTGLFCSLSMHHLLFPALLTLFPPPQWAAPPAPGTHQRDKRIRSLEHVSGQRRWALANGRWPPVNHEWNLQVYICSGSYPSSGRTVAGPNSEFQRLGQASSRAGNTAAFLLHASKSKNSAPPRDRSRFVSLRASSESHRSPGAPSTSQSGLRRAGRLGREGRLIRTSFSRADAGEAD